MRKIGLICPPIPGHLNPMAVLGRALVSRGLEVTVFGTPALEPRVRRETLNFQPLGPATVDLASLIEKLGHLTGNESLRFAIQGACRMAEIICLHGPDTLSAHPVDLLLVDQNEPAGGTLAEHLSIPFVSVCPSLPLNREPAIPPPFVPWSYSLNPFAKLRNRLGYAIADRMIAPINRTLNRFRKIWNLAPLHQPDDSFSRLAQLSQMPREFDFPRLSLPPSFHYLGPFLDDHATANQGFPFEKLDGRPLVYASLGTLQSGAGAIFRRIAEACAPLDLQLVMPAGEDLHDLPGNPIVVPYAPQMELLRRASLTITHGGLNTVMQSLACGVPMVAIPMTHDQPAIAARLARTGAGRVLSKKSLSAEELRGAIQQVLNEESFRSAAMSLREAIIRAGGAPRAAEIIEECLTKYTSAS